MPIRMVATDIDGTLTLGRGNLLISTEAVKAIRRLESIGVMVSLVSGNSLPITAGLARYIGASGPSIAENGCVLFYNGETIHVCQGKPPRGLIEELKEKGFRESWQNPYRHHDVALYPPPGYDRSLLYELASRYNVSIYDSGYAIHIQPRGTGKGAGLREASRLTGISLEEVLAVGDGLNDKPLFDVAGKSACPSDADPRVKELVDYVASKPGGLGFAEIAEMVAFRVL
ncbi:MAG: phosphoglycolate phosphatase [Desulfurococcales archaeon]|nr:phosphoglycolate phosphatase [Desulfurococcales archaeon]